MIAFRTVLRFGGLSCLEMQHTEWRKSRSPLWDLRFSRRTSSDHAAEPSRIRRSRYIKITREPTNWWAAALCASPFWRKKGISFTARWMWELDVDCEFGTVNPNIWKQLLQQETRHVMTRIQDKWINMVTGQCSCRMSSELIVNHPTSQVILIRPYLPTKTLPETVL